jgi:hypothetical protein
MKVWLQSFDDRLMERLQRIDQELPLVPMLLFPPLKSTCNASRIGRFALRGRLFASAIGTVDVLLHRRAFFGVCRLLMR